MRFPHHTLSVKTSSSHWDFSSSVFARARACCARTGRASSHRGGARDTHRCQHLICRTFVFFCRVGSGMALLRRGFRRPAPPLVTYAAYLQNSLLPQTSPLVNVARRGGSFLPYARRAARPHAWTPSPPPTFCLFSTYWFRTCRFETLAWLLQFSLRQPSCLFASFFFVASSISYVSDSWGWDNTCKINRQAFPFSPHTFFLLHFCFSHENTHETYLACFAILPHTTFPHPQHFPFFTHMTSSYLSACVPSLLLPFYLFM